MGYVRGAAHAVPGHAPVDAAVDVSPRTGPILARREVDPVGRRLGEQVLRGNSAEDGADYGFADAHLGFLVFAAGSLGRSAAGLDGNRPELRKLKT